MTAPKKIGNLRTEKTDEQENLAWAEVLSHKNKLLLNSDWTQLSDSGLTEESIEQWRGWRQQLKNINRSNFSSRAAAEVCISKLARRTPFNAYILTDGDEPKPARDISLDVYRARVIKFMDKSFNERVGESFLDNPLLVDEQFREAVDFLAEKKSKYYPLISVTAELYNMSEKAVAEEFVARKVNAMKRLANLKQKYHFFQKLVLNAADDVQLAEVQGEIKQWISTLT